MRSNRQQISFFLIISFSLVLCTPLFLPGQNYQVLSTNNKKAEKLFLEASDQYNRKEYDRAVEILAKAVKTDPQFIEAFILSGDILSDQKKIREAVNAYRSALAINPDFSPNLYYILANLQYSNGLYEGARSDFARYLTYERLPKVKRDNASNGIRACDFAMDAMRNPVPFNPVNLGDSVNTTDDEFVNAITADDQVLYFTRKLFKRFDLQTEKAYYEEDFFFSVRNEDSSWKKALNLGPPINTRWNEGALTLSPDGRFLFFAGCQRPGGFGSCDLYWSKREGSRWSEPENLGPEVNSAAWESQPSFSSDGSSLYFASNRKGGRGGADIWKTTLNPDGTWTVPVNLGDSVNTSLEEQTPFIHPDDRTLYFSSKGFQGMGGADLFCSRRNSAGNWGRAVNLGYPINTCADEYALVLNAIGDMAYISSDKLGGEGKMDIYRFKLYEAARPNPVTYFRGVVYNRETKQRLRAEFDLADLKSGKTIAHSVSDSITGEFLLILPADHDYALGVSKPGYLFYSDHFSLTGIHSVANPFIRNIPLQEMKVGETVILKNIFFDTDKFEIRPESEIELRRLTELLTTNREIRIELSGHTDHVGTREHNDILSLNRAKAEYDYLVNHGIDPGRMTFAGYGFSKPVDTNETEQGRSNNRRTEFKIIGK